MALKSVNKKYGYTLIEVLIVISIIVLTLTITFAAIATGRNKSNDGVIQQQLGLMRVEAERIYKVDRDTNAICAGITSVASQLPNGTTFKCVDGPRGYAFEAVLSDGTYYCTDSFGRTNQSQVTNVVQAGPNCTGSADCNCN